MKKSKNEIIMEYFLQTSRAELLFTKRVRTRSKKDEIYNQEKYHDGWRDALMWCLGIGMDKGISDNIKKEGNKNG